MTIVLFFGSTVYFLPGISTKIIKAEIKYEFSDSVSSTASFQTRKQATSERVKEML